jgi:carboxypeptidase C (cathepsin A)
MTSYYRLAVGLFATALLSAPIRAYAQREPMAQGDTGAHKAGAMGKRTPEPVPPSPADATTQGTVDAGGQHILYTAIAGTITVGASDSVDAQLGPDGQPQPYSELALTAPEQAKDASPTARMSYVAYFKTGAKSEDRPVTFFYNGGPGSATVWLHMGSLGPKHVVTAGDTHLPAAPYTLIDNQYTLLDVSDVVFIDMPGTGFGRLFGRDAGKAFWGVDEDAAAFARFIARFLTKYGRWNSPKYLFGESYGTTRSAVLAADLENRESIDLNGVILLSQIFNFSTDIDFRPNNSNSDLSSALGLPTFAATAWYHKKLPQQPAALEPFLSDVEQYAMGPYLHALGLGTDLGAEEKQQVAEKLHEYTGLPAAYWAKANLRVSGGEFEKELLDSTDMTTGRLDTRFSGPTLDPLSEESGYDPQSSAISAAYIALFNDYVRKTLHYGEGQTYLSRAQFNGVRWDFRQNFGAPANVSGDLARAMKTNPRLKVMVNGGYFDLATPFFTAEYEDKHLPIPQSLAKNIEYDWYESGHMVYVRDQSLKQLHDRVAAFITSSEK